MEEATVTSTTTEEVKLPEFQNQNRTRVFVSRPDGSNCSVQPGHSVFGEFYSRFCKYGQLTPILKESDRTPIPRRLEAMHIPPFVREENLVAKRRKDVIRTATELGVEFQPDTPTREIIQLIVRRDAEKRKKTDGDATEAGVSARSGSV